MSDNGGRQPPCLRLFWPVPAARVEIPVPPDLGHRGRPFFCGDTALVPNPGSPRCRLAAWERDFDAAFRHWHEDGVVSDGSAPEGNDAYRGQRLGDRIADVFDRVETDSPSTRPHGRARHDACIGKGSGPLKSRSRCSHMRDGKVARPCPTATTRALWRPPVRDCSARGRWSSGRSRRRQHPSGPDAAGRSIYSDDGFMSAFLRPRTGSPTRSRIRDVGTAGRGGGRPSCVPCDARLVRRQDLVRSGLVGGRRPRSDYAAARRRVNLLRWRRARG